MADQKTRQGGMPSGFFGRICGMMRDRMSQMGGSCCSCAEKMAEMMPGRRPVRTEKEESPEETGGNARQ